MSFMLKILFSGWCGVGGFVGVGGVEVVIMVGLLRFLFDWVVAWCDLVLKWTSARLVCLHNIK